jgi:hypothetical protein
MFILTTAAKAAVSFEAAAVCIIIRIITINLR